MKQSYKRILSLLLSVVMLASMMTVTLLSVSAEDAEDPQDFLITNCESVNGFSQLPETDAGINTGCWDAGAPEGSGYIVQVGTGTAKLRYDLGSVNFTGIEKIRMQVFTNANTDVIQAGNFQLFNNSGASMSVSAASLTAAELSVGAWTQIELDLDSSTATDGFDITDINYIVFTGKAAGIIGYDDVWAVAKVIEEEGTVVINNCDSTDGWYLWPGDTAEVSTFCREGKGSIRYAPHGGGYNFTYVLPETMDFTNAVSLKFEFWANTGDVFSRTGEGKSGIILSSSNAPSGDYQDYYLEPSDDGQNNAGVWCDVESYKSQEPAENSWATVNVPIDWSTMGDEFNPAEVKYIRFYGLEHTGSEHEEYIDNVRVIMSDEVQVPGGLANIVVKKIAALGTITPDKEADVAAARAAYEALSDEDKALVNNLDVLEAAEAAIEEFKGYEDTLIEDGTKLSRWSWYAPGSGNGTYDGHIWMWYQVSHCLTLDNPISVAGAQKIKIDLTGSYNDRDGDYNTAEIFARISEGSEYGFALTSYTGALPNGGCDERLNLNDEMWSTYGVRLVPDYAIDARINILTIDWNNAGASFDPNAVTGLAIVAPEGSTSIVISGIWKSYKTADLNAAKAVDDQIAALGEITLDKEADVAAARAAYDALTDVQKALVENLETLTAAEKAIETLKVPTLTIDGKNISVVNNGTTVDKVYYAYIGNNDKTLSTSWSAFVIEGRKYTQFNGNAGYKKTAETTALDKAGCYAFFITYNDGQKVIRYANIKSDVEATDIPVIVKDGNVVSFECTENIANIYYTYDGDNDYEYVNWYSFVVRGRKSGENRGTIGYNAVVPDVAGGNNNGRYISLEKAGHYTFVVNYADGKQVVVKTVIE